MTSSADTQGSRRRGNFVVEVSDALRLAIQSGEYPPGSKLPSEAKLTEAYTVSRTVIREAIAALRADGLVQARQGAGVFVLQPPIQDDPPFQSVDYERISSVIELLELRTGVEVEAAGLAALRRSPQQEEAIVLAHNEVRNCIDTGRPTSEADFNLHLAISDAANNPRFREFLLLLGSAVIPRAALKKGVEATSGSYLSQIHDEHGKIVDAILGGDEEIARATMREHLRGSQNRYRMLLKRNHG